MKIVSLAIASLLLTSGLAMAQNTMSGPRGGRMAACRDDAQKYCADKMGRERRACLQSNMANLSDGCKAAMNRMSGGNTTPPAR